MKYIYKLLLICWSVWTISENGNMRPSDNTILWLLSAITFIVSFVAILDLLYDINNKNDE